MFSHGCLLCSVVAISIFGVGCVSPSLKYYTSAEEENAAKQLTVPTSKSVIYVFQKMGAYHTAVLLDNRILRELSDHTYCMEVVEPGAHRLGIRAYVRTTKVTFFNESGTIGKYRDIIVSPDHTYFFEAQIKDIHDSGFGIAPESEYIAINLYRITEKDARDHLKSYRLSNEIPEPNADEREYRNEKNAPVHPQ